MTCSHNLVDVWEDISRAPIMEEVTHGEAAEALDENPKRYAMCASCGIEVNPTPV